MKVLVTGAATLLGVAVKEELQGQHELRLAAEEEQSDDDPEGDDPLDPALAEQAVAGVDAVLYIIPGGLTSPIPSTPEATRAELDAATRGTYNLYAAAARAGVRKVVHVSSLSVMGLWPQEYIVTEVWRPRPPANARALGCHLSEQISREFSREHEIRVLCVRMATLVREEEVVGQPFDPTWLDVRDAAVACRLALEWEPRWHKWSRVHVGPTHPFAIWPSLRSSLRHGEMKWQPQHDFRAWWPSDPAVQEGDAS